MIEKGGICIRMSNVEAKKKAEVVELLKNEFNVRLLKQKQNKKKEAIEWIQHDNGKCEGRAWVEPIDSTFRMCTNLYDEVESESEEDDMEEGLENDGIDEEKKKKRKRKKSSLELLTSMNYVEGNES